MVGRIRFALERLASPRHSFHVAQLSTLGHLRAMIPEETKNGRGSFWMHLTCGAVVGVFSGVSLALELTDSFTTGSLLFLATVGVCALAAVFFGDRFWEAINRIWVWKG